jgi:hypothetical protein
MVSPNTKPSSVNTDVFTRVKVVRCGEQCTVTQLHAYCNVVTTPRWSDAYSGLCPCVIPSTATSGDNGVDGCGSWPIMCVSTTTGVHAQRALSASASAAEHTAPCAPWGVPTSTKSMRFTGLSEGKVSALYRTASSWDRGSGSGCNTSHASFRVVVRPESSCTPCPGQQHMPTWTRGVGKPAERGGERKGGREHDSDAANWSHLQELDVQLIRLAVHVARQHLMVRSRPDMG